MLGCGAGMLVTLTWQASGGRGVWCSGRARMSGSRRGREERVAGDVAVLRRGLGGCVGGGVLDWGDAVARG